MSNELDETIILNNTCSICLGNLTNKIITNCSHNFCKKCIDEWFNHNKLECPLCRSTINYIRYNTDVIRIVNYNHTTVEYNQMLQNLSINYKKMRFLNMILLITLIYQYYISIDTNKKLLNTNQLLDNCNKNYTDLLNQLNDTSNIEGIFIIKNSAYRLCMIPLYYINKCFNN